MIKWGGPLSLGEIQNVLDSFDDGVLLTDACGNVLLHNAAYVHMTRMPFDHLVGMNMRDILHLRGVPTCAALRVIEENRSISMTLSNEEGTIVVTANPVFDVEGALTMVITYVREVTDIVRLREELEQAQALENYYYQIHQTYFVPDPSQPVAVSEAMRQTLETAKQISQADATLLLTGESGVGKDVLARFIHENSPRSKAPFVAINCGAVPANLLESELFGYAAGAFTGASRGGKTGLFEAACGGTLFLDEIGDTTPDLQVALLRVLESRQITRIGAVEPIPVDVRIIAATHRNLREMVDNFSFRNDLFYRLNVLNIHIPPLRERREDIIPLCILFLNIFNNQYKQHKQLSREVARKLVKYDWPGNVRELRNVIERCVVMTKGDHLSTASLPAALLSNDDLKAAVVVSGVMPLHQAVEETEKQILSNALVRFGSTRQVAQALGIDHSTVVRKLNKYKIRSDH